MLGHSEDVLLSHSIHPANAFLKGLNSVRRCFNQSSQGRGEDLPYITIHKSGHPRRQLSNILDDDLRDTLLQDLGHGCQIQGFQVGHLFLAQFVSGLSSRTLWIGDQLRPKLGISNRAA